MTRTACWLLLAPLAALMGGCAAAREPKPAAAEPTSAQQQIAWLHDYEAALAQAKEADKPLMVDVFATWCAPCKLLDENVFSRSDVAEASRDFIAVRVDGDKRQDLVKQLSVTGYPAVVFLTPKGEEITRVRGAVPYQIMLEAMQEAAGRAASPQPEPH